MLRKKRTRRRSRWLPKQPRLGARMCQGTFFFSYIFMRKTGKREAETERKMNENDDTESRVKEVSKDISTK